MDNIVGSCLLIIIQLCSFIQAFRCRKLPSHLSEAINIVYGSFIVTVSLCVMFPIYFYQKNDENGELVQALVLSGNNLILLLFMYGKKIYIILFCPQKNTKKYFRGKQLQEMRKNAISKLRGK